MSNQNFVRESDSHGVGCGPPRCICIQLGPNQKDTDSSCIFSENYKITPDKTIYEFIGKVRQNISTAIFTINMAEKPLSKIVDLIKIFVPQVKIPESVQSKSIALQVRNKTMKEIIDNLGLEISTSSFHVMEPQLLQDSFFTTR